MNLLLSFPNPIVRGKQIHKPYFYYRKLDSKVENINLIIIEHHIKFKDPERNKAKLLEMIQETEHRDKDENKNGQDIISELEVSISDFFLEVMTFTKKISYSLSKCCHYCH